MTGACYRQVTPAPTCSIEKLASVTSVVPLVRLPELVTIRFANDEIHTFGPARKS